MLGRFQTKQSQHTAVPSGGRSSGACDAPRGAQHPPRCPAGLRGSPAPRQPQEKADFASVSKSPALIPDPTQQLVNNPNTAEPTGRAKCKQGRRECPDSRGWHNHVPGMTAPLCWHRHRRLVTTTAASLFYRADKHLASSQHNKTRMPSNLS